MSTNNREKFTDKEANGNADLKEKYIESFLYISVKYEEVELHLTEILAQREQ